MMASNNLLNCENTINMHLEQYKDLSCTISCNHYALIYIIGLYSKGELVDQTSINHFKELSWEAVEDAFTDSIIKYG